jgi:biopolymer transport protein ExbD
MSQPWTEVSQWNKSTLVGVSSPTHETASKDGMNSMKKRRRRILPRADINVTPFIDILLVLLVIFMTISPVQSRGVKAEIPQPPPPGPHAEPEKTIILSVDRFGVVRINQTRVETEELVDRLREIFSTRSDRTIFLQADNDLLFNDVAQLIDAAKGAGAERMGLMTETIAAK